MSLIYKTIKNNTNNSIIVNGTYIGPLSESVMSSDVIDLIDKQYFTAGILVDLGEANIGTGTLVIDTKTIQFYKKPALGIPKSHLDPEVKRAVEISEKSALKGQISLNDLSDELKSLIQNNNAVKTNNNEISIDSQMKLSEYYKKPPTGIPKSHLNEELKRAIDVTKKAALKGQISFDDLSFELKSLIERINSSEITTSEREDSYNDLLSIISEYYKKPPTGIPKSHLNEELKRAIEITKKSALKGQISFDDLNEELKSRIENINSSDMIVHASDSIATISDTTSIEYYVKPPLGIPKSDLESDVVSILNNYTNSLQKGQVNLEDLSQTLQNIILSGATDLNGDGVTDVTSPLLMDITDTMNSGVIKEMQLEKGVRDVLNLARTAYQKPLNGITIDDLSTDVRYAIDNPSSVSSTYGYWKDPVEIFDLLPTTGNSNGDVRLVLSTMSLWMWDGTNSKWNQLITGSGTSSTDNTVISNPLITKTVIFELFANQGQTKVSIGQNYDVGTNQLEVYLNGILMTKSVDYNEVDNYTIEFLYPLQEDDYINATINSGYSGAPHNVETIIITDSSDKRNVRSMHSFTPDGTTLRVFLNGIMVECGSGGDYIEVDENNITFNYDLYADDRITLRIEGATLSETVMNQFTAFKKIYTNISKQMSVLQKKVDKITAN